MTWLQCSVGLSLCTLVCIAMGLAAGIEIAGLALVPIAICGFGTFFSIYKALTVDA